MYVRIVVSSESPHINNAVCTSICIYIYVCVCVCVTGVAGEARAQRAVKMASSHISASAR